METWYRPDFYSSDSHRILEFLGTTLSSTDALVGYLVYFPERLDFVNPYPDYLDTRWVDAPPSPLEWLAPQAKRTALRQAKGFLLISGRYRDSSDMLHLQYHLKAVELALQQSGIGALDILGPRFLFLADFEGQAGPENRFQMEDHMVIHARRDRTSPLADEDAKVTVCSTLGMRKLGRPDVAITLREPLQASQFIAGCILVNEVAHRLGEGKFYTRDDQLGMTYPNGRLQVGFLELSPEERRDIGYDSDCLLLDESGDYERMDSDCSEALSVIEEALKSENLITDDSVLGHLSGRYSLPELSHRTCRVPAVITNVLILEPEHEKEIQDLFRWASEQQVWPAEIRGELPEPGCEELGEYDFVLAFPCGCARASLSVTVYADGTTSQGMSYPCERSVSQETSFPCPEVPFLGSQPTPCSTCARAWKVSYEAAGEGRARVSLVDAFAAVAEGIEDCRQLLSQGRSEEAMTQWRSLESVGVDRIAPEYGLLYELGVDCALALEQPLEALKIAESGRSTRDLRAKILATLPHQESEELKGHLETLPEAREILERFQQEAPNISHRPGDRFDRLTLSASVQGKQCALQVDVPVKVQDQCVQLLSLHVLPAGLVHQLSKAEFEDDPRKKATIFFLAARSCLENAMHEHALVLLECAAHHFPESTMVAEQMENLRQYDVSTTILTEGLRARL